MALIVGTAGNDVFAHSAATSDSYSLLGGNDRLTVFAGTVEAFMGEGNDIIELRGGTSTIHGESGADLFELHVGGTVDGGGDNDTFNVRAGSGLSADGGPGADRFNFAAAVTGVLLHGGDGNDSFAGDNFTIGGAIHGDAGNDLFTGFRSGLTLFGGLGNDVYRLNTVSNAIFSELAGQGNDTIQLMRGADYTLPSNIERVVIGTYAGSDTSTATITLNGLNNAFTGHGNDETVNGLAGNDRLLGKSGIDTLNGGDGTDLVDGGAGNDVLSGGTGNDQLVGRSGNDVMIGGAGNDIYYVDSGTDVVAENAGEGVDLIRTEVTYHLPDNVENGLLTGTEPLLLLAGNDGDNVLTGSSVADEIHGEGGNDTLYGRGGADNLAGFAGNDVLDGGPGGDTMSGGAGDDAYYVDMKNSFDPQDMVQEAAGAGIDTIYCAMDGRFEFNNFTLADNVENGVITGFGEFMAGNALDNHLIGGAYNDSLYGLDGHDTLDGGGGNDILKGHFGYDTLSGGAGDDILEGGALYDTLTGGAGADRFDFIAQSDSLSFLGGYDTIMDFAPTIDSIDLSGIDANVTVDGNQAFSEVAGPTGVAGQLWLSDAGNDNWFVYGDTSGDGIADFTLLVHTNGGAPVSGDIIY